MEREKKKYRKWKRTFLILFPFLLLCFNFWDQEEFWLAGFPAVEVLERFVIKIILSNCSCFKSLMYFWLCKIWVWLVFLPWRCMRHSVAWVVLHEHHLINNHQPPAVHEVQSTFNMEIILFIFWNEWYSFIIRCNNNFTSRVVPCEKGDQKSNPLISVFFCQNWFVRPHGVHQGQF